MRDAPNPRRCGPCTACCTLMGVTDLDPPKPPATKCPQACSRGCRIYADRPKTCRDFACLWLQGAVPRHWRPDVVGIVFVTDQAGDRIVGFYDPARPKAWKAIERECETIGRRGAEVVVGPANGKPEHRFTTAGRLDRPAGV